MLTRSEYNIRKTQNILASAYRLLTFVTVLSRAEMICYAYPSRVQAPRRRGGSNKKKTLSSNVEGLGSRVIISD